MTDKKHPLGKINEHDEGETELAFAQKDGTVFIHFKKPIEWIGLSPEQAIEIAQILIHKARQAGSKKIISISL